MSASDRMKTRRARCEKEGLCNRCGKRSPRKGKKSCQPCANKQKVRADKQLGRPGKEVPLHKRSPFEQKRQLLDLPPPETLDPSPGDGLEEAILAVLLPIVPEIHRTLREYVGAVSAEVVRTLLGEELLEPEQEPEPVEPRDVKPSKKRAARARKAAPAKARRRKAQEDQDESEEGAIDPAVVIRVVQGYEDPVTAYDIAPLVGLAVPVARKLLEQAVKDGKLVRASRGRYLPLSTKKTVANRVARKGGEDGKPAVVTRPDTVYAPTAGFKELPKKDRPAQAVSRIVIEKKPEVEKSEEDIYCELLEEFKKHAGEPRTQHELEKATGLSSRQVAKGLRSLVTDKEVTYSFVDGVTLYLWDLSEDKEDEDLQELSDE